MMERGSGIDKFVLITVIIIAVIGIILSGAGFMLGPEYESGLGGNDFDYADDERDPPDNEPPLGNKLTFDCVDSDGNIVRPDRSYGCQYLACSYMRELMDESCDSRSPGTTGREQSCEPCDPEDDPLPDDLDPIRQFWPLP
jgi:hypothetical protein